jgi:hypothetical protein
MRAIVIGVVVLLASLMVAANVVAFIVIQVPALRRDAYLGSSVMAAAFGMSLVLGYVVWRRFSRD